MLVLYGYIQILGTAEALLGNTELSTIPCTFQRRVMLNPHNLTTGIIEKQRATVEARFLLFENIEWQLVFLCFKL